MRQSGLASEEMGRFGGNVKDVEDFEPMRPVRPMMAKNPLFEVREMVSDDIIFEGSNKSDQACSSSFFCGVSHPPEPDDMDLVTAVCVPVSENKLDSVCLMKSMSAGHFIVPLKKLSQETLSPAESIVEEPDESAALQSPFSTAHTSGHTDNSQQQPDPERECVWDASLSCSGNASSHSSVDSMNFVCAMSIASSPSKSTQENDVVLSMDKSYSDSSKGSISMVTDSFECTKRASDSSSGLSDESNLSNFSGSLNKLHRGNDPRWNSILAIRARDGILGMSHFKLLKRLGCGEMGSVYLSELSGTRCHFAMKVMDKASIENRNKLSRAQTEREILQLLNHPFLPTLYTHFETDRFSCSVMEYCPGGDLYSLRQHQPGKHFSEYAARFYAAEVLLALEYLHMIGVVYRDLKPENVLIRDDGHIMLSDFDLSFKCAASPTSIKPFNSDPSRRSFSAQPACIEPSSTYIQSSSFLPHIFPQKNKKNKFRKTQKSFFRSQSTPLPELLTEPNTSSMSFVGTHEYLAPEIIKGEVHGSAVDWWTFGIFLHELLYGKTPFKGLSNRATLFNVIDQHLKFPESPVVSYASKDLIQALLTKDPSKRLGTKRGATEIKQHPFFEGINWALIRCSQPPEIPRLVEETEQPPKYGPINPVELGSNSSKTMGPADMKSGGKFLDFEFF